MNDQLNGDTRLLAAIAYGEASTTNDLNEIGGIAFAVANLCRAWGGKIVSQLKTAKPRYSFAWDGANQRFNKFMNSTVDAIKKDTGMSCALDWASAAIANKGTNPSNGALFWDGLDFKIDKKGNDNANHPKRKQGFKYGDPVHNIFNVAENKRQVIIRWQIKNKKTGKIVDGAERGRYDAAWVTTAAHGKTIFWKHPNDFLQATGNKEYD